MHILFLLSLCDSFGVVIWLLGSSIIIAGFQPLLQSPKIRLRYGPMGVYNIMRSGREIPKMVKQIRPLSAKKERKYQNQLCISIIILLN